MGRIGLRRPPPDLEFQRAAPPGCFEQGIKGDRPGHCSPTRHLDDHVSRQKTGRRGRRRRLGGIVIFRGCCRQHNIDRGGFGVEHAPLREPQPVESLEGVVVATRPTGGPGPRLGDEPLRFFGGRRAQQNRDCLFGGVGRVLGRPRQRGIHPPVAGDAPVKPGHLTEVVAQREIGQPDLLDPQRTIEGIEHRHLEGRLSPI